MRMGWLCLAYILFGLLFAACTLYGFHLEVPLTHGLRYDIQMFLRRDLRFLLHPGKHSLRLFLSRLIIGLAGNFLLLAHLLALLFTATMHWTGLRLWLFCFEGDQFAFDLGQLHFELVEGVGRVVAFKPFQLLVQIVLQLPAMHLNYNEHHHSSGLYKLLSGALLYRALSFFLYQDCELAYFIQSNFDSNLYLNRQKFAEPYPSLHEARPSWLRRGCRSTKIYMLIYAMIAKVHEAYEYDHWLERPLISCLTDHFQYSMLEQYLEESTIDDIGNYNCNMEEGVQARLTSVQRSVHELQASIASIQATVQSMQGELERRNRQPGNHIARLPDQIVHLPPAHTHLEVTPSYSHAPHQPPSASSNLPSSSFVHNQSYVPSPYVPSSISQPDRGMQVQGQQLLPLSSMSLPGQAPPTHYKIYNAGRMGTSTQAIPSSTGQGIAQIRLDSSGRLINPSQANRTPNRVSNLRDNSYFDSSSQPNYYTPQPNQSSNNQRVMPIDVHNRNLEIERLTYDSPNPRQHQAPMRQRQNEQKAIPSPNSALKRNKRMGVPQYRNLSYLLGNQERKREIDQYYLAQHLKRQEEQLLITSPPRAKKTILTIARQKHPLTVQHAKHCFDVLIRRLAGDLGKIQYPSGLEDYKCRFMVTWFRNNEIRGSQGTLQNVLLSENLAEIVTFSIIGNEQLEPMRMSELNYLTLKLTKICSFTTGCRFDEWQYGKHGILLDSTIRGRHYYICALPEVFTSVRLTKEQVVSQLLLKAGFDGDFREIADTLRLTNFVCKSFLLSYKDYTQLPR